MTWTRFDDAAATHPKARLAGNEAWALWAAAVQYSNRYLTDGHVTLAALAAECLPVPISMAKARALAEKCVDAKLSPDGVGLFQKQGTNTYIIHDFLDWNPSKSEVEARRKSDRDRKRGPRKDSGEDSVRNDNGAPLGIPSGKRSDSVTPRASPAQPAIPVRSDPDPDPRTHADPKTCQVARARQAPPEFPRSVGEFSETLKERAEKTERNPYDATFDEPKTWPEVQSVAAKLHETAKLGRVRLGSYAKDRGVQAIVSCFAADYTEEELLLAAELLPKSDWWSKDRKRRGLSSMTPESVRITLTAAEPEGLKAHRQTLREVANEPDPLAGMLKLPAPEPPPPRRLVLTREQLDARLASGELRVVSSDEQAAERERWQREFEAETKGQGAA